MKCINSESEMMTFHIFILGLYSALSIRYRGFTYLTIPSMENFTLYVLMFLVEP